MNVRYVAVACLCVTAVANAAVIYDENGVGFVDRDVQTLYDWNNTMLQISIDGQEWYDLPITE